MELKLAALETDIAQLTDEIEGVADQIGDRQRAVAVLIQALQTLVDDGEQANGAAESDTVDNTAPTDNPGEDPQSSKSE